MFIISIVCLQVPVTKWVRVMMMHHSIKSIEVMIPSIDSPFSGLW
jgi:hypothetical protein